MSGIRKLFSFRRAPKAIINPKEDFQQLDYVFHDAKVFQTLSDRQKLQLFPIRDVLLSKVAMVTSVTAKIKTIEDAVNDSIEQMLAKSATSVLEDMGKSLLSQQPQKTKGGLLSFFSRSKSANLTEPLSTQKLRILAETLPKNRPLLPYSNMQLILRLQLCKEYLVTVQGLLERSEISTDSVRDESKLLQLVDATLLGTSSERVAAHLSLFGPKIYQHTLQTCFYSLFEAEIQALLRHMDKYPIQLPAHEKLVRKQTASTYLLDTLELNTKSRCILAWKDPEFFGGFRPLADDHNLPVNVVVAGRREFFPEGEKIATLYVEHLKNKLTEYQNTKEEDRDTLRQGAYFIVATILLDWLVCTI